MPVEADTQVVEAVGQDGISPKIKLPAWGLTAIGGVLLVIGYIIGDNTVTAVGWSILASGPAAGLLGFWPKPGNVVVATRQLQGPPSDAVLADELSSRQSRHKR